MEACSTTILYCSNASSFGEILSVTSVLSTASVLSFASVSSTVDSTLSDKLFLSIVSSTTSLPALLLSSTFDIPKTPPPIAVVLINAINIIFAAPIPPVATAAPTPGAFTFPLPICPVFVGL